ncbi:MAG: tetratricopeptide repeat protein [Betaproteobacteria bacterium]
MSEIRALLLTDVVDSTRIAEAVGHEAMTRHWVAHDRAAHDLLRTWRGIEIERTDGLLAVFESAADAAAFAMDYHRALASLGLPFKSRAGLHVGQLSLRESSADDRAVGARPLEVDGLALHITARVMATASGGQTLLTNEALTAIGQSPMQVLSHGHWRMKGLQEPVELFEIGNADASFTPPPDAEKSYRVMRDGELWLPVREVKHSVPAERDSFVGRHEPLLELARKIQNGARLVSVLGIGGTGKTRLVTRFAWTWLGDFPGGVWFCDLSQARTVDGIVFAVAQGLDVPLGRTDPVVQLAYAIAGRGKCLVILDNFEQVARHAEATLGHWLDRTTNATFLVTSREVLGIPGEEAIALPPLSLDEGSELFRRRAAAAVGNHELDRDDQAAIEPLVQLLDSLPLAIELAAARTPVLRPRALLERMNDRFRLLALGGGRQDRQATIRATLDWSWDLLTESEKIALGQLSVFEGGFTLDAAESLLDLSASNAPPWKVDVVQSLVQKSFVRSAPSHRFELLHTVQEYAAEHLATEGRFIGSGPDASTSAKNRHSHYFAQLDTRVAVADTDNLVVACQRAVSNSNPAAAVGALAGAWTALKLTGPFKVALELADRVGKMPALSPAHQATVHWVAGSAHYLMGNASPAQASLESGLAHAVASGDARNESLIRCHLGELLTTLGSVDQARENLQLALALARELGDQSLQCSSLNAKGALESALGAMADSRSSYEEALALASAMADERWAGGLHGNLGALRHDQGQLDAALHHYKQALELTDRVGDRRWAGNTHCNLGLLFHDLGQAAEAQVQFEAALATAREMGHSRLESTVLCNLGIAVESQGRAEEALAHFVAAVSLATELGQKRSEGQFRTYLGRLYARSGNVPEARACLTTGEELLEGVGDRIGLGLLLCARVETELADSNSVAADALIARVETLIQETAVATSSELAREYEHVRTIADAARQH